MPPKNSPAKPEKPAPKRRKVKVKKAARFTVEELNEEFDIFLNTYNPYMSENCVEFDRKTQTFKPIHDYRKPVTVLKIQGTVRKKKPEGVEILFGEIEEGKKEEKMRNKFNFRSVATQTTLTHPSDQGNQIDPSLFPVLKFKGTVSKAEMRSAYETHEDQGNQIDPSLFPVLKPEMRSAYETHEKKTKETSLYAWIPEAIKNRLYAQRKPVPDSNRRYLRLCERMVDQNLTEAHKDYSYYDNPNDEFKPDSGSLLPLWSFSCKLTRGLPVTGIAWSAHFPDLFAVGFRTYKEEIDEDDLGRIQEDGWLCLYSLKGPNYPEKIVQCPAAVRCLSFHPYWSHLLAVGCEGGVLNVFDLRREKNDPAGSNKMTEKELHHDTVSEIKWLPDVLPQKFCTVSTDGKVFNWQFIMNDLSLYDAVTSLRVKEWPGEVPPKGIETVTESTLHQKADEEAGINMAGMSLSVNPTLSDFFLVGTETGVIYECSFNDKIQVQSYESHKHSVSRVHWNPYHPRVFLSSSEDMTIRIWDHSHRESLFEFFFENEVKDACWAPFSSTLFAAISGNAVVYVFDLALDKKKSIGSYTVYTAKQNINLTVVCFHPTNPVLLVGDERGRIISFKLSPNLRSSLKAKETLEKSKFIGAEIEKLEKLLAPATGRKKQH